MGKERKSRDIVIKVDGADCSDQTVVCNKLNDFFISIASNINDSIPASNKSPLEYMGDRLPHSFFCLPATSDEVQKLLSSFVCKGRNLKSIPMFIYKYLSPVISPIISKIFNISIEEGVFPDCLKTGRVVPLHKSGDATVENNYRPITTFPVLSKLFEKLLHSRMYSFASEYNLIVPFQYGFQSGLSTSDALLEYANEAYKTFNDREINCSAFLDFRKAFDCVDVYFFESY